MERIDAHQHFWKYDPVKHEWISPEMSVIRRNFLPADLAPVLNENKITGSVAVQAESNIGETQFLLQLANENSFIKGVVGWVDLQARDIVEQLAELKRFEKLKGFRHILQSEPDDALMLQPPFMNGIRELARQQYTYDLLLFPRHLDYAAELVQSLPEQRFVIDHLAKPDIRNGEIKKWEKAIRKFADFSNCWCKVSGMVTEADWKHWKREEIYPYLDVIMDSFGAKRLMFGSDWPVCLVAASYSRVVGLVNDYFGGFSNQEKDDIFGKNAVTFYNL